MKENKEKKISICFFSLGAYPYLANKYEDIAGGAELQQVLLARELIKRGYRIIFIVGDYGQDNFLCLENIEIYKLSENKKETIIFPSLSVVISLWRLITKINADVFYQRCAGIQTGYISLMCIFKKKKFIYSISGISDVDGTILRGGTSKKRFFYDCFYKLIFLMGIKLADCIIAQSKEQQILLQKNYSKKSVLIKSIYEKFENIESSKNATEILWVGGIRKIKQPEFFLELAKQIPFAQFRMIGGPMDDLSYYEYIKSVSQHIPNVEFTGFIPPDKMHEYFRNASIFINTSQNEGFPNTFLQAWAFAIPVISLNVDPDEIICEKMLGLHSKTFMKMVDDVRLLLRNSQLRETMGNNGKNYIEREHLRDTIITKYEQVFKEILKK